ncbi:uncharacterized protein LOC125179570 [Hyalella azteca]|uniref:Uncharacterized protein LOC125179570 n=1 Tax=Hyalella azteca TaxID=294128 RepID=A0A979FY82_HYAAZ|nr:uncharacterized protein LOC125179570 [Hyalella azteca]
MHIARYYLLLVAVLAAGTTHAAADVYVTKLDDEQLHSPVSETLHVIDECECHMRCQQRSGCTGGSYDPVADVCRLTDGDATTVTTRPLAGSSAFFKFSNVRNDDVHLIDVWATDVCQKAGLLAGKRNVT